MASLKTVQILSRHYSRSFLASSYNLLQKDPVVYFYSTHSDDSSKKTKKWSNFFVNTMGRSLGIAIGVGIGITVGSLLVGNGKKPEAAELTVGERKHGLPTYTMMDVGKHSEMKDGIWVTFHHGVYDITDFISEHPGGDKILMAAGGSVEPFWALYAVHKMPHILDMLEKYRIGNLSEDEVNMQSADDSDPYSTDPRRHPALAPRSLKPFNAEPPPELLADSFITPNDLFFVRNHLPVPDVQEKDYELEISGLGIREVSLKLSDLKKLPKRSVTATIQCAGNRRSEMTVLKPVKGLDWGTAAISNAVWSGPLLTDVLKKAGLKNIPENAVHVQFEGLDTDPANSPYGASIPIEKALDPHGDVILAYEMNGEPIPRDHGYPVRIIVPGTVGARNVKWLSRIVISEQESDAHWQQRDYKGFNPSVDWDTVNFDASPAIQELPVISAICEPKAGSVCTINKDTRTITVKGYAWSGGGKKIVRVDLTADEGQSWQSADLVAQTSDRPPRHWAWTLWSAEIPVPKGAREMEIWAKAVDSSYNTQPESFKNIWNLRGVLSNAYHRVKVSITSN